MLGLALVWELLLADLVGALTLAAFVTLSFVHFPAGKRLPDAFDPLVALSALLNGFGFAFGLFERPPLYDEVAHTVTIFTLSLAAFYLLYHDAIPSGRRLALATATFGAGVAAGSLWEVAEWIPEQLLGVEVIYGLGDTMTDLAANAAGALAARTREPAA